MVKVIFIPKFRAPVNCKNIEYFVDTDNWDEAIEKAKAQFKKDNKLYYYYSESIATTIKVL